MSCSTLRPAFRHLVKPTPGTALESIWFAWSSFHRRSDTALWIWSRRGELAGSWRSWPTEPRSRKESSSGFTGLPPQGDPRQQLLCRQGTAPTGGSLSPWSPLLSRRNSPRLLFTISRMNGLGSDTPETENPADGCCQRENHCSLPIGFRTWTSCCHSLLVEWKGSLFQVLFPATEWGSSEDRGRRRFGPCCPRVLLWNPSRWLPWVRAAACYQTSFRELPFSPTKCNPLRMGQEWPICHRFQTLWSKCCSGSCFVARVERQSANLVIS